MRTAAAVAIFVLFSLVPTIRMVVYSPRFLGGSSHCQTTSPSSTIPMPPEFNTELTELASRISGWQSLEGQAKQKLLEDLGYNFKHLLASHAAAESKISILYGLCQSHAVPLKKAVTPFQLADIKAISKRARTPAAKLQQESGYPAEELFPSGVSETKCREALKLLSSLPDAPVPREDLKRILLDLDRQQPDRVRLNLTKLASKMALEGEEETKKRPHRGPTGTIKTGSSAKRSRRKLRSGDTSFPAQREDSDTISEVENKRSREASLSRGESLNFLELGSPADSPIEQKDDSSAEASILDFTMEDQNFPDAESSWTKNSPDLDVSADTASSSPSNSQNHHDLEQIVSAKNKDQIENGPERELNSSGSFGEHWLGLGVFELGHKLSDMEVNGIIRNLAYSSGVGFHDSLNISLIGGPQEGSPSQAKQRLRAQVKDKTLLIYNFTNDSSPHWLLLVFEPDRGDISHSIFRIYNSVGTYGNERALEDCKKYLSRILDDPRIKECANIEKIQCFQQTGDTDCGLWTIHHAQNYIQNLDPSIIGNHEELRIFCAQLWVTQATRTLDIQQEATSCIDEIQSLDRSDVLKSWLPSALRQMNDSLVQRKDQLSNIRETQKERFWDLARGIGQHQTKQTERIQIQEWLKTNSTDSLPRSFPTFRDPELVSCVTEMTKWLTMLRSRVESYKSRDEIIRKEQQTIEKNVEQWRGDALKLEKDANYLHDKLSTLNQATTRMVRQIREYSGILNEELEAPTLLTSL